jgi:putative endonuclease
MDTYLLYILYSPSLDRYYVGCCKAPLEERLRRHLSEHKGFTGKAKDWQVRHVEAFGSKTEAYRRERQIKARKSRAFIESIIHGAPD